MNTKLGFIAFGLALLAVVAGPSYKGGGVSINPRDLASIVDHELDHVTAFELGRSIMDGESTYIVIDLRDSSRFAGYHIPGAINKSLVELVDASYNPNQAIVLYSDGGVHSAQGMFLLWAKGYKHVFMLKGGLREWQEEVLHPVIPPRSKGRVGADSVQLLKKMSLFFHGSPALRLQIPERPRLQEREKMRDEC